MKFTVPPLLLLSTWCVAQSQKQFYIPFDFNQITCATHTDSIIGQEIYFFPRNQMFQADRPEKDTILFGFVSEKPTSIMAVVPEQYKGAVKKYNWTVLNVFTARINSLASADTFTNVYKPVLMQNDINNQFLIFSSYSAFEDKLFKIVAAKDSSLPDGGCMIKLKLQDPHGDYLFWDVNSQAVRTYTVCFKGYIQYLRANALNKRMYLRNDYTLQPFYYNHLDGSAHESIPGQGFMCSDVTIFNIRNHIFPFLGLVFTDSADKTMIVDPGNSVIPEVPLTLNAFCSEAEHNAYLKREKKVKDSLIVAREKLEAVYKAQPAKLAPLIKKYGKDTAMLIAKRQIVEGMTKEMCMTAWGNVHTTQTYYLKEEPIDVWGYSKYRWIRFRNNRVIRFNE